MGQLPLCGVYADRRVFRGHGLFDFHAAAEGRACLAGADRAYTGVRFAACAQHPDVPGQGQRHDHRRAGAYGADDQPVAYTRRMAQAPTQRRRFWPDTGRGHAAAPQCHSMDAASVGMRAFVLPVGTQGRCVGGRRRCAGAGAGEGAALWRAGRDLSRQHHGRERGDSHDHPLGYPHAGARGAGRGNIGIPLGPGCGRGMGGRLSASPLQQH